MLDGASVDASPGAAGPSGRQDDDSDAHQLQIPSANEVPANRKEDYATWLAQQKQKWRQNRQERKRRKVEALQAAKRKQKEPDVPLQVWQLVIHTYCHIS